MAAHKISYIEKKVSEEGVADELVALGYRSTPVVVVDGKAIVGYNTNRLAEALL